jgi:hypothetical protein
MESDRCLKCGAPVGPSAPRCPLCGADLNAPAVAPPSFQPAIVGMKQPGIAVSRRPEARPPDRRNLILVLVAVAGLLLIAGLGYAGWKMIVVPPVAVTTPPPPTASAPMPLTLEGVAVADPTRADPSDLWPAARKRISEASPDCKLVDISFVRGKGGVVNLTTPGAQIVYRCLYEEINPRVDKKDLKRERIELSLREAKPALERTKAVATDEVVADPLCVWSAAWRAAVASGINPEAEIEARYARRPKADKGSWILTPLDKPEGKVEIDGVTCAIRSGR